MKVVLSGPVPCQGGDILRRHFGARARVLEFPHDGAPPASADLEDAKILVSAAFDREFPPLPELRLLQVPAAGVDRIDFDALPAGCAVCNAFEHEIGIGEYVLAAMLHWTVDLACRSARFKAGSWADSLHFSAPFRPELAGRTLGLVGYGHIGQAVARRARGFDVRILAVTRTPRALEPAPDRLEGMDGLDDLLRASDFVVVACPLGEETRGLIGRERLALMRPDAVLINVARGPVVDEDALYEALRQRRIAGAVLDVWYRYARPGAPGLRPSRHPFHELDNVVMTPHCSGWTEGLIPRRFAVVADNIERLLDGRTLRNQVWPAGPRSSER
ncbi:MAG: 2-hydroxyacid dehydrogenase [Geminicoccaceae bacterium]